DDICGPGISAGDVAADRVSPLAKVEKRSSALQEVRADDRARYVVRATRDYGDSHVLDQAIGTGDVQIDRAITDLACDATDRKATARGCSQPERFRVDIRQDRHAAARVDECTGCEQLLIGAYRQLRRHAPHSVALTSASRWSNRLRAHRPRAAPA